MKTTGRKFRCIGLDEPGAQTWSLYFRIGQVYEEFDKHLNDDYLDLWDNDAFDRFNWAVDKSQFELVESC